MVLTIIGETRCILCDEDLQDSDEIFGFPAFVLNENDILYPFSDSACHLDCLRKDPVGIKAINASEIMSKSIGPGKRRCAVCHEDVMNYDDYFLIGYLTSQANDPLFHFNFTHFHLSHLQFWESRGYLKRELEERCRSGQWKGAGLDLLISKLTYTEQAR